MRNAILGALTFAPVLLAANRGALTRHTWISKIFPGTVRDYWVYAPAQYRPEKPA